MALAAPRVRLLAPDEARDCSLAALSEKLGRLSVAEPGPLWLHGRLDPEILDELDGTLMHELAMKSLRGGPERPRVEEFTDHLYLSLFFTRLEGPAKPRDLRVFVGENWLVSLADLSEEEYSLLRERVQRNVFRRSRGTGHLLYVIADWAVETLNPVLAGLDDQVDELEDVVVVSPDQRAAEQIFEVKRRISALRRNVLPLRDVTQRLASQDFAFVEDEAEVYFRDVHDDLLRVVENLDAQRDVLASALDLYQSSTANRLNEVMKRLTLVATLFMPITFITGFFGMNFDTLPFGSSLWFGLMLAALAGSVLLMLLVYRRSDGRPSRYRTTR